MTYTFIYEPDHLRIMPAVLFEARADIPELKNQIGTVIKSYIDTQLALIKSNTIFYKIETELGVLAGYFVVEVNDVMLLFFVVKRPRLLTKRLRPAFKQFQEAIDLEISIFIQENKWEPDVL